MIEIKRADVADAETIKDIKVRAYNKEINTFMGRDGGPDGYDQIKSQIHIINRFLAKS
jgi:hypothetical protein